jgi:2-keto-3-deoxy-L-rhamnonate aldolase RhmA
MVESFIGKLRAGRRLLGTMVTLPLPSVAEGLALCGYDWLWIDLEHSALSLRETGDLLAACGGRMPGLVRVPNDAARICQVLDLGADGIIVPQVRTVGDAEAAARAARYPPAGARSVGLGPAQGFGLRFREYLAEADAERAVVVQIENADAVEAVDEILAVPGVDAALIGPYDLSGSMGLLGQVDHPEVRAATERVLRACADRKVPLGIFALKPEDARRAFDAGYRFVSVGIDAHFLLTAARAAREAVGRIE